MSTYLLADSMKFRLLESHVRCLISYIRSVSLFSSTYVRIESVQFQHPNLKTSSFGQTLGTVLIEIFFSSYIFPVEFKARSIEMVKKYLARALENTNILQCVVTS